MNECLKNRTISAISIAFLILFATVATVALLWSACSAREADLKIKGLKVSIWPEYDDPRVLVLYRGEFENGVGFPAWVNFYIPPDAEINGAGIARPDGQLLWQEHKINQEGSRKVLSINISTPAFFLEYYYNPFKGGALKSFEQKIENKYPIEAMSVEVQKPLKAEGFALTPESKDSYADPGGFTYFKYNFQNLKAQSSVKLMVAYKKEDPNPSVARKTPEEQGQEETRATQEGKAAPTLKTGLKGKTLAGIILLAAAAVVAAAMIMRRSSINREKVAEEQIRGHEKAQAPQEGWNFCPRCGAQLKKEYTFCPGCGYSIGRGNR